MFAHIRKINVKHEKQRFIYVQQLNVIVNVILTHLLKKKIKIDKQKFKNIKHV